jgi:hypothetical protein
MGEEPPATYIAARQLKSYAKQSDNFGVASCKTPKHSGPCRLFGRRRLQQPPIDHRQQRRDNVAQIRAVEVRPVQPRSLAAPRPLRTRRCQLQHLLRLDG